jgi:hypothetical protein
MHREVFAAIVVGDPLKNNVRNSSNLSGHASFRCSENFKFDDMTESVNPSSRGPKDPTIAGFDLQVEEFTMLTLKQTVACSGVEACD